MPIAPHRRQLLALLFLAACRGTSDSPVASTAAGAPLAAPGTMGVVVASPTVRTEIALPAGDSLVDLAALPLAPGAALLVRAADGHARLLRWIAGERTASTVAELPADFEAHAVAVHPGAPRYFVSGASGGHAQLVAVAEGGAAKPVIVFQSPRALGRMIVSTRPFDTDSGPAYRLFLASSLDGGVTSLRSITEHGRVEYQVVGPAATAVKFPEDEAPGGVTAPSGVPMSLHPRGEPLLWRDARGCTHSIAYDRGWSGDSVVTAVPCDGWTTIAPNGAAYQHWTAGRPGVTVIGYAGARSSQGAGDTFLRAPVAVPDGRGVIGLIAKGGQGGTIAYVPIDMPFADVANAWQLPPTACEATLFANEGGAFRAGDGKADQLYAVYDHFNYDSGPRVPFLATTDLFWENFGAAFNGVFILAERQRALPAFWSFVDSANAALAASAPESRWARAFAAISASRTPAATGEAALITRASGTARSTVLDTTFDFSELTPRGHYTGSPEMAAYFRAVHYLTQMAAKIDPAPLAALPAPVQQAAREWIEGYHAFIAPPRSALVWKGEALPAVPWARHPATTRSVFPLSWGLDNEILESTVYHDKWPADEQINVPPEPPYRRRLNPSGLDVATVYGNSLARALLAEDLGTYPRLASVLDGIRARRPALTASSSVYERWLDALGNEWADSTRFPGAPARSRLWSAKRLQTGLASWATLREATVLVNERAGPAEAGEGGFEQLIAEQPRGYVEPAPRTFQGIAALYESLARTVGEAPGFDASLRDAIVKHLTQSAAEARRFGDMAESELRGRALSDSDFAAIQDVAGSAEHQFLIYKSLGTPDEGLPTPEPIAKVADVAGGSQLGILEVAVGKPLEWRQLVPYFGRRQIVVGGTYSYYEFLSKEPYDNARWRKELGAHPRPSWIQPLIADASPSCGASASR